MLVPFARTASAACGEALQGLALPHLRRLLARMEVTAEDIGAPASFSAPHERVAGRAQGLPAADGLIPFAALQARQAGEAPGEEGWAWITPAHWRVGRDHVDMAHPQDLRLDAEESQALLAAMQPYFAEDGITLRYDAPLRWLARGDLFRTLPTASLDRVIGRAIDPWMPSGEAGRPLRRLQQEMQMLLYTLPLNDARQRGGLLPVNSFWASGSGVLAAGAPAGPATGLRVEISPQLREAALQADWAAWTQAWQALDADVLPRLLQDCERGRPVQLTLCGEAGARTWTASPGGLWRRLASRFRSPSALEALEGL